MVTSLLSNKYLHSILYVIVLFVAIIVISLLGTFEKQHDFHVYYCAAQSFILELNPYDNLNPIYIRENVILPFAYLPLTIFLFIPFTLVDYHYAYILFLLIKLIALGMFIYISYHHCVQNDFDKTVFILLFLCGFQNTIIIDLLSGNITIFEQLILWSILLSYQPSTYKGTIGLLTVSYFKFYTLAFIIIYMFKKWLSLIKYLFVFVFFILINYWVYPQWYSNFLTNFIHVTHEANKYNISLQGIINQISYLFQLQKEPISYLFFALVFTSLTLTTFHLKKISLQKMDYIILSSLTLIIILPRFKDYSYIMALIPAFYVIKYYLHTTISKLLTLGFLVISWKFFFIGSANSWVQFFIWYQSYFGCFLLYGISIYHALINNQDSYVQIS